jgi:lysophospholipase L1-like esterase
MRNFPIAISYARTAAGKIAHPAANPLKITLSMAAGETLAAPCVLKAELHTSRFVGANTTPLAVVSVAAAPIQTEWVLEFSSAQMNQPTPPEGVRKLWLVVYAAEGSTVLYTFGGYDVDLGWHAISQITPPPPAVPLLAEKGGVAWMTGTEYAAGTMVSVGTVAYVASSAHTSAAATEPGVGANWETVWVVLSGGNTFTDLEVTGTLTAPHIHGNLAGAVYSHVRNESGGPLTKGTPVYVSGFSVGQSRPLVAAANASNAATMPAIGILDEDLANNASGHAVISGTIENLDTSAYSVNTELFVANGGGLTSTAPTPRAQPIAIVERSNANTGAIIVTPAAAIASTSGLSSGWPDVFFRGITPTSGNNFLGRNRWYVGSGVSLFQGWSLVPSALFTGRALKRDATATTGINGPAIWYDDLGLSVGDQVTVCALVTGNGATTRIFARTFSGLTVPGQTFVSSQLNVSTLSNNDSFVASATPTLVRLTLTVAATETGLVIYSTHSNSGFSYQIEALWVYKGSFENGPQWPNIEDGSRLAANHAIRSVDYATGGTNYTLFGLTVASGTSQSTTLDGTSFSSVARDLPFTGWGDRYTPAGISFNAVQIASLTRTTALESSRWRTIGVVVRTSNGNSALTGATVVAVGSALVDPQQSTITNLTILLKDPITGLPKTITNADLLSEYFIGVYARNISGGSASCGEPLGTMPNPIGTPQSYYLTTSDPLSVSWSSYSANLRMGFRHLLLVNPAESFSYTPTPTFAAALAPLLDPALVPEFVTPPTFYGVQGREANLYFDNLINCDWRDYSWDVASASSVGSQQNERWTWTPAGAVTSGNLTVSLISKTTGTVLATRTAAQRAAASSAGSGLTKKCLFLGDSLTAAGTMTQTILDIAGPDVMDIELYGTQGTAPNKHEGRGGWSCTSFTSATHVGTANPLWDGSAVNFGWYLSQNSIPALDWVFIQLGTNDVFSSTSDAAALTTTNDQQTKLDIIINSIKASNASTKVGLLISPPPSFDQDSFGDDYGVGQTRLRFKRNILIWAKQMVSKYSGQEAARVYLLSTNTALDTINNMERAASAPVNSRSSVNVQRQSNGVHPATSGYQQLGDAVWAFLKYNA